MFFNGSRAINYETTSSPDSGSTAVVSVHRLANNNVLVITSSLPEIGTEPYRFSILDEDGIAVSTNNFLLDGDSNIADVLVLQNGGFAILTNVGGIPSIVIYGPNATDGVVINIPAEASIGSIETSAITQLVNGNIALLGSFQNPVGNPDSSLNWFLGALQISPSGVFTSNIPTTLAALTTDQIVIEARGFNALPGDSIPGDPDIINVALAWHELPSNGQLTVTTGSFFAIADFNSNTPSIINAPTQLNIPESSSFDIPEIDFGSSGEILVHWVGFQGNISFDFGSIFDFQATTLLDAIDLQTLVDDAIFDTEFDAINIGQVALLSDGSLLVTADAVNSVGENQQDVIALNFELNLFEPGPVTSFNSITTIPNDLIGTQVTTNELSATADGFEIFWQNGGLSVGFNISSRSFVVDETPPPPPPVEFNGGQEFLVNQQTFGAQLGSNIAQLSDGRFIAVWTDLDGSNFGGGGEIPSAAQLAADDIEGLPAAQGDGSGSAILGRFLSANGTPIGDEFVISQVTQGQQQSVSVVALDTGGFAVAWTSTQLSVGSDDLQSNLMFRAFDSQAVALSADINLAPLGNSGEAQTDITIFSDGSILIGSTRETLEFDPITESSALTRTALLTRLTGNLTEPTAITTEITVGSNLPFQNSAVRDIDALSNAGFVALIETAYGMRIQLIGSDGIYAPQLISVDNLTLENQSSAVLATSNGGFVVFGRQLNPLTESTGIYMMRFNAQGEPTLLSPVLIIESIDSDIATTLLSDGNIAVAWSSRDTFAIVDGGFETINTANVIVINDEGTVIRETISAIQPEDASVNVTALVADDTGGFGILWQEGVFRGEDLPDIDVYFRAFTTGPSDGNDFVAISEDAKQQIIIDVTGNDGVGAELDSIVSVLLDTTASRLNGLTGVQVANVTIDDGRISFQLVDNSLSNDIDGLRPGETADILVTYKLADDSTRVLTVSVTGQEDITQLLFNYTNGSPLPENIGVAGQAVLYDADSDLGTATYSVASDFGIDNNRITINSTTGVVSFIAAPNYENPLDSGNNNIYNIALRATSTSGSDEFNFSSIDIADVNEQTGSAPVISSPAILSPINEDSGTRVITSAQLLANASDADGDALTIIGLTASTGNLTNNNNGTWNYRPFSDQNGPVTFNYQVTDGLSLVQTSATLQVNPINDAPSFININTRSLNDDLTTGTVFSVARASDPDGDILTYSLTNNAGGRFGINAATGEIFVADAALLATTGAQIVQITVRAADQSGLSRSIDANLTVFDADFAALDNVPGDISSTVAGPIGGSVNGAINFVGDRDWYRVDLTAGLTYTFSTGPSTLPISGSNEADTVITLRDQNGIAIRSDDDSGPGDYSFLSFTPTTSGTYFLDVNEFGNNALMDFRLTITSSGGNQAPTVVTAPVNIVVNEDSLLNQSFNPALYFADPGDILTYRFASLPTWLSFTNGSLVGTPTNNFVGTRTLSLIATDSVNQSITTQFTITVVNTNDAPILVSAIEDLSSPEDTAFGIALNNASSIFADPDIDTTLTYTATLENGDPLPAWLNFNTTSFVFSGTPPLDFTGAINVRITATDQAGLSASDTFVFSVTAVNDAPVTTNGSASGNEDGVISGSLPASDVDSALLTYAVLTPPANGTIVIDANGTYTYTPNANFNGTDSFTFQTSDGDLLSNASTISLTVNAVNDAPIVASPLTDISSLEDNAVSFILPAGSFSDIDGDTLTLSTSALPSWLSFDAATRSFTGTPPLNFFGNATVTVTATDGSGASASDSFVLKITPVNDAPELANSSASGAEDSAITGTLIATDIDSPTLTYSVVSGPSNGTLALNAATGAYTYTPNTNYNGNDSFELRANDGELNSGTAVISLTVTAVNDAPIVAAPVTLDPILEDNSVIIISAQLLAGASDVDNANLTIAGITASIGTLVDNGNGSWTFTPPADDDSAVTFNYTVSDGSLSVAQTATLDITPVNDAPVVATPLVDQSSAEDEAVNFTLPAGSFTDVDNTTLALSATLADGSALPAWLSFDAATGAFTGTPPANFNGALNLQVSATDAGGLSANSTFALNVTAVNDAAVAADGTASGNEDNAISGTLLATDLDSSALTYAVVTGPTNGTLTLDAAIGAYVYTPNANYNGTDSFTFRANDGSIDSNVATVNLTVAAVNDAPVVATPLANQSWAEDVAVNFTLPAVSFTDVDNTTLALSATLADGSALPAWLSFDAATGSFTGTPPANFNGALNLQVTATDAGGLSASSTFALNVTAINDAPVVSIALADQVGNEGAAFAFTVPADSFNDVDTGDTLTLSTSALPTWLSFDAATRSFTGTPGLNEAGSVSVTVTATDSAGATTSDIFVITITDVNTPPTIAIALADQNSAEDDAVSFNLPAGSFVDAETGVLALTTSTLPTWLSFDAATRNFTGTPPTDFNGAVNVTVTATDAGGLSVSDSFVLNVTSVNDAPVVATPLADQSSAEDEAVSFTLPAGSFTDVDSATLTLTANLIDGSALPTWLSFNAATGTFTGTPQTNFNGSLNLQVTASDAGGLSASSAFALNITAVNDAAVAANIAASSDEDTAITGFVSASDVDNATLTYAIVTGPANGTLTLNAATGAYVYTPNANYNGSDSFTFRANDGSIDSNVATVNLAVAAVNDVPTDIALSATSVTENAANGTVVATATAIDVDAGDTRSYALTDNAGGRFAINSVSGAITVANGALLNFEAATSHAITIRVTDSAGASYDETFTIGVNNVNEAPNSLTRTAGGSIAENSANGAVVAQFAATDPDSGATLSYALTDNAGGRFAINATTGQLTVANGGLLDFETANNHNVTVRVTDQFGLSRDLTTNIGITDVADGTPTNVVTGTAGSNFLFATAGADQILALDGNDFVFGLGGNDILDGGNGDDWLDGGTGNDLLVGGAGRDFLFGGTGDDILIGGAGRDLLFGGSGQDTFRFLSLNDSTANSNGRDEILDFNSANGPNHDLIDLSAIDANTNAAGDQAFNFIGNGAFTNVAGQLRYNSGNGRLSADVNGDGNADFSVNVSGSNPFLALQLDATDFVL